MLSSSQHHRAAQREIVTAPQEERMLRLAHYKDN
jgi:hypothetical protein